MANPLEMKVIDSKIAVLYDGQKIGSGIVEWNDDELEMSYSIHTTPDGMDESDIEFMHSNLQTLEWSIQEWAEKEYSHSQPFPDRTFRLDRSHNIIVNN